MHAAARFQFGRAVGEFAQWRAVPDDERSPAPAWWWQPAFEVAQQQVVMPHGFCEQLELATGSTYAAGASVLLAALSGQEMLPWPDEFPRKIDREPPKAQ